MSSGRVGVFAVVCGLTLGCASAATTNSVEQAAAEKPVAVPSWPVVEKPEDPMVRISGGVFEGREVTTFWLDRYEVGLEDYRRCVQAEACGEPKLENEEQSPHPDGPVTAAWPHAREYCSWVGKRLPTADEWLWAAAGRGEARVFPWGAEPPSFERMFASDGEHDYGVLVEPSVPDGPHVVVGTLEGESLRLWLHLPTARGSRPLGASRDGVLDMLGNVQEAVTLPSGEVSFVGGSYAYQLPEHPEAMESGFSPEEARQMAAKQLMTPLSLDGFRGHERGFGFRCAADDRGRPVPSPDVQEVSGTQVYAPDGTRRFDEAASLCRAADAGAASWTLPSESALEGLAAAAPDIVGPLWISTGKRWTRGSGGQAVADGRATALVLCVRR